MEIAIPPYVVQFEFECRHCPMQWLTGMRPHDENNDGEPELGNWDEHQAEDCRAAGLGLICTQS